MFRIAPLLLLTTLAACGDSGASNRAAADPRSEVARIAAEVAVRTRLRNAELRGVQVFGQALPDSMAVCGRARNGNTEAYAPYVAVIGFDGGTPRLASFQLGSTGAEASRVFVEMVDRCFDGGGPATTRMAARATPPLPSNPVPEAPVPQASEAGPATPTGRIATARTGANIRNAIRGGDIVRSLPAGGTLDVIGEAQGGWYQVAERGSAVGWVHGSVVEVSAPQPVRVAESR